MTRIRQIKLGASVRWVGYYAGAWREADVPSDGGVRYDFCEHLAGIVEKGLFDILFFADNYGTNIKDVPKGAFGRSYAGSDLEPFTLSAALSRVTRHIGIAVTASTTFLHPYHLARFTLSLDHLTGGRAGWNVVTSSQDHEAVNFDQDAIISKAERYQRARESVEVVFGLWNSFEADAFVRDKASGVYFDPEKMNLLNHKGQHFQVRGPLNMPRSPQGRPIIIQAGSSIDGVDLAAAISDVVYTAQNSLDDALSFVRKIEEGLGRHGRERSEVLIMPGVLPIIGSSEAEAREKYHRMQESLDPLVGLSYLSTFFGDLSACPLDRPVTELGLRAQFGIQSRGEEMLKLSARNNWTLKQLYQSVTIGNAHKVIVGTAKQVADHMQEWFEAGAADGFNVIPYKSPAALTDFVEGVVPELQRRGLYRTAYEADTLRGNLGLPMPRG